ncbi:annexin D3-like [Prosopis cineraria]|uniref:annexin D3-like n=1 Tax=Prosopis cineraria TaxID=364024 RepID=UPI00240EA312|nr:annexin D3-like [Prosopis cineraria]
MASLRVPEVTAPIQDSERLRKAFEGFGTDEEAVISVLGHRNANQRKKIRETYQQLYNESLIDRLHSELSGDFRNAVILWTTDPPERDAKLANAALKGWRIGIKELQVLVEIACASSPNHLMAVRQAYCSLFDCSLEEYIVSNVHKPLSKLLVGLVSSYRYDKEVVDPEAAMLEAARLNEAINKKQLDHDDIVWILSTRNVFQLRATFAYYKQLYGNTLEQDIKNCGKGDFKSLLNVIVCCIDCPEKHFAKVVKDSIWGLGTDEDSLTRAFVTRAEIDLSKVEVEYAAMYKSSLEDDTSGDTSGDYRRFLMTLLGK